MRLVLLTAWGLALVGCAGCQRRQNSATPGDGVAQVAGQTISAQAFQKVLNTRSAGEPTRYASTEAKQALLEELIAQEAVYAKAKAAGFDQRPDIQQSIKRTIASRFQEEEMSPRGAEPPVTDAQVEDYYHANQSHYLSPAKAHGAVIFMRIAAYAEADKRAEFLATAQAALKEAKKADKPADFSLVVIKHSEDQATRYKGGDIGWVSHESKPWDMDESVVDALLTLDKPGDFAPLVSTAKGVYIVKLLGKQPVGLRPLAEVKELIRGTLLRHQRKERDEEFAAAMKAGLDIRINGALLESIQPAPASKDNQIAPSLPGGSAAVAAAPLRGGGPVTAQVNNHGKL